MTRAPICVAFCLFTVVPSFAAEGTPRDLRFFLQRLRTVDHLPELEPSHTAMASTWERKGGNADGTDFKRLEGKRNILLDVDGPGCIHRIFTGMLGKEVAGTRIQIFLDGGSAPIIDLLVEAFFDDKAGPIPYPLVFHKTYPGTLFPIPFARHCLVQLVNEQSRNWGNYWQIVHTRFASGTDVRSLSWPLNEAEKAELKTVCETWLKAESVPPEPPAKWSVTSDGALGPGQTQTLKLDDCGVIRQMRVSLEPATQQTLRETRLQVKWDGSSQPSVDVPLAYFFGDSDATRATESRFGSLLLGATKEEAYCCFPMPFANGAEVSFANGSGVRLTRLAVRMDVEQRKELPFNWGRFHATWTQKRAALPDSPRFGAKNTPVHVLLERKARGKYIGTLLHVGWPWAVWWGEGDWLFWTDEEAWPPSYHGTGSEEYFNSGWCRFDRKAVSGYITTHPGEAAVYSFHLNDGFQFQKNVRVAVETAGTDAPADRATAIINEAHPFWGSTAYWYALPAMPAGSMTDSPQLPKRAFEQSAEGVFEFNTGLLKGRLQATAKNQGLISLIDTSTGMELAKSENDLGLFKYYRTLSPNKRWGDIGWLWPKTGRLLPDGTVEINWPPGEDRPFDMTALFRWSSPETLDVQTTVKPQRDLPRFEVFIGSYFNQSFHNSIYVSPARHGGGQPEFLPADVTPLTLGTYLSFPRDLRAAQLVYDGRWEQGLHPVQWSISRYLAAPLAMRHDPKSDITLLLMSRPQDCFAIECSYDLEPPDGVAGHHSTYLSLFGEDLKAGQAARAFARLVVGHGLSPQQAIQLYERFCRHWPMVAEECKLDTE